MDVKRITASVTPYRPDDAGLFVGFALVGVGGVSLPSVLLATTLFGIGALAGGRISDRVPHRGRALFIVALMEAALLGTAAVIAVPAHVPIIGLTSTR